MRNLPNEFALSADIRFRVSIPIRLESPESALPGSLSVVAKAPPEAMEKFNQAFSEFAAWAEKYKFVISDLEIQGMPK